MSETPTILTAGQVRANRVTVRQVAAVRQQPAVGEAYDELSDSHEALRKERDELRVGIQAAEALTRSVSKSCNDLRAAQQQLLEKYEALRQRAEQAEAERDRKDAKIKQIEWERDANYANLQETLRVQQVISAERDAAKRERDELADAIHPKRSDNADYWTVPHLANLAAAHRQDSEDMDATEVNDVPGYPSWDASKARLAQRQQHADLLTGLERLEQKWRTEAKKWGGSVGRHTAVAMIGCANELGRLCPTPDATRKQE